MEFSFLMFSEFYNNIKSSCYLRFLWKVNVDAEKGGPLLHMSQHDSTAFQNKSIRLLEPVKVVNVLMPS